jgi:hypothetical protein
LCEIPPSAAAASFAIPKSRTLISSLDGPRIWRHEQVVGLEVAVNDPLVVGGGDRPRRLLGEVERDAHGKPADGVETHRQAVALQVLHDDVRRPVRERAVVEGFDDVRVPDGVRCARFVEEPADRVRIGGQPRVQHLHRRLAPERRMLGEVDDPHPPVPDLLGDFVVPDRVSEQAGAPSPRSIIAYSGFAA